MLYESDMATARPVTFLVASLLAAGCAPDAFRTAGVPRALEAYLTEARTKLKDARVWTSPGREALNILDDKQAAAERAAA